MDQELLVKEQVEAALRFLREFSKYAPIKSAAWLRETDSGRWYLYVVSDSITDQNVDVAYGEVLRIAGALEKPRIDPFRVRIIAGNSSVADRILEIQQRHETGTTPAPWQPLEPLGAEDAHVYDMPVDIQGI